MAQCENCGAPDNGSDVICKFCNHPIAKDLLASAIACPVCRAPNRAGRTECSSCRGSLLLQCIFCGHATPASKSDCDRCGEAFAGAAERKQQREAEKLIGAVGGFVSNLMGGGSGHSHSHSDDDNDSYGRRGGGGGSAPPMDT